ncbi:MAG: hypothetical protein HYS86_02310 [Candidatus Chisholmbacteria bacterium]|nr:hypothetical protein [Candidatus Chisholmbacteria bacterium]
MSQVLLTATGIPGAGKTELVKALLGQMHLEGVAAHFVEDFPLMWDWVRENIGRTDLVRMEGETFVLVPEAYRFLSPYVAGLMGREAARLFNEGAQVVIVEAARGAFGKDRYDHDLFMPLQERLCGFIDEIALANVEVASSIDSVVSRAELRFKQDPTAPPPDIPMRYVNGDTGLPWASSVSELEGAHLGMPVVMNESSYNAEGIEGMPALAETAYHNLRFGLDQLAGERGRIGQGFER